MKMMLFKMFMVGVVILFLMFSCVSCDLNGDTTEIQMTIMEIQTTDDGQFTMTLVKSMDGKVDRIRGDWGSKGDVISGYWTEGHLDPQSNGFHTQY